MAEEPPPADLAFERLSDTAWRVEMKASGLWNFLFSFGLFWTLFIPVIGTLIAVISEETGGGVGGLFAMLGLFMLAGLVLLVIGFRRGCSRYELAVEGAELRFSRILAGRRSTKRIDLATLVQCELQIFYREDYRPVHGFVLRDRHRKLRFGTRWSREAKLWLDAKLRETLAAIGNEAAIRPLPESMERGR